MDKFKEWFVSQYFYSNMRFVHGDALFDKDGDFFRILAVQIAWEAWQSRQAEVDQLKEVLDERTKEWLEAIKLGTYFQDAAKTLKDEVDQLQSQINEMAEVGVSQESELNKKDEHAHNLYYENLNLQTSIDEKDKKLNAVEQILNDLKESMISFKEMDLYDKGVRVITQSTIEDLEKALRGKNANS